MTSQNHMIMQQVFQVELPGREHVQELYSKTSSLFNNELAVMMENLFDELVPADQLLKIETLEIDLGSCAYGDFEKTIMEGFIPSLRKEISSRLLINGFETGPGDHGMSTAKAPYASLLLHYLATGTLPWWATGELLTDQGKTFDRFLMEDPAAFKAMLLQVSPFEHVRRRLAYRFSEQQLRAMISLLEPQQAAFIFEYHEEVVKIQQEEQIVQNEVSEFRKAIWLFILHFLLADLGSHFDRKMFVKSTLAQMSAHFNISYESILLLFSSAIESVQQPGPASEALPLLIRELMDEHVHAQPAEWQGNRYSDDKKNAQAIVIQKQYEALRYYLLLGSLPFNTAYSREELAGLFIALKEAVPALVRALVLDTGSSENARKRMAAFDEPFVTELVELVEPANAEFITGYAAKIRQLQSEKHMVKIQNDQFRLALWEFILAFLFTDTGSVFNTKMFVEDHVRRMAKHYNLQFHELLVFLAQGVGEDHRSVTDNTSLFYLLTGLLKEQNENSPATAERLQPATADAAYAEKTAMSHLTTRDVLQYWLTYGFMPWWSESQAGVGPEELIAGLIHESPAEALFVLKLAGSHEAMRNRLLCQVPGAMVLELFDLTGNHPVSPFIVAITNIVENQKHQNDAGLRRYLLNAAWEALRASSYSSFNRNEFLKELIPVLSQAWQLPAEELFNTLKSNPVFFESLPDIPDISASLPGPGPGLLLNNFKGPDLYSILMPGASARKEISRNMLFEEALKALDYFLLWNTWPEATTITGESDADADELLRQLIAFVYSENQQALKNILQKETHHTAARMRLHDVLSQARNAIEKNARALLNGYFNTDVVRYLKETVPVFLQANGQLTGLLAHISQLGDAGAKQAAWRTLFNSPAIIHHAAYHYRAADYYDVLRALGAEKSEGFLKDFHYLLNMSARDTLEREQLSVLFREFSLLFFSRPTAVLDVALYLREFFGFLSSRGKNNMGRLYTSLLESGARLSEHSSSGISQLVPVLKEQLVKASKADTERKAMEDMSGNSVKKSLSRLDRSDPESEAGMLEQLENELQHKKKMEEEARKKHAKDLAGSEADHIYIRNAGLVILHPLLPTYFSRTGLVENGRFIDAGKQHRAVHLLQYAATGLEESGEHLLVLNKILCGMDPAEPVEKKITLTEQEKQVTNELLQAVIGQWQKLGNTSAEGLRGSFLCRDGSLSQGDEAWTLKVKEMTFDVLLDHLPWGLTMIKAAWMDKAIHVEWR